MKKKIAHCRRYSKFKYQNRRKEAKSIPLTQIHDRSLPGLGTHTSLNGGGAKLLLWAQTSPQIQI